MNTENNIMPREECNNESVIDENGKHKVLVFVVPIEPKTKKNSQQIIQVKGRPVIIPSKQYKAYEKEAIKHLPSVETIDYPVEVKCTFYMATRRRVDLCNLLEGACDMLVKGGVLADDNSQIVVSHDGSRVMYDKLNPRTVFVIRSME